jgi:hypothetical protein
MPRGAGVVSVGHKPNLSIHTSSALFLICLPSFSLVPFGCLRSLTMTIFTALCSFDCCFYYLPSKVASLRSCPTPLFDPIIRIMRRQHPYHAMSSSTRRNGRTRMTSNDYRRNPTDICSSHMYYKKNPIDICDVRNDVV